MGDKKRQLTVGVNNREEKEVVLVQETLNFGSVGVGEESIGKVLNHLQTVSFKPSVSVAPSPTDHGRNPLASVNRAVEHNRRLPLATRTPKVDTRDRTSIQRVSRRDHRALGRVRSLEIPQELDMVVISVVRVEPREIRRASYTSSASFNPPPSPPLTIHSPA